MIKCQECGQTGEMEFNSNNDPSSDFMMWPSHTNEKGLNIYVLFCFSCGTFNEAAPNLPLSREQFEYFNYYALERSLLEKWCNENNVPAHISKRMVKVKTQGNTQGNYKSYKEKKGLVATGIPSAREQLIIALVVTIMLVTAVVLAFKS